MICIFYLFSQTNQIIWSILQECLSSEVELQLKVDMHHPGEKS